MKKILTLIFCASALWGIAQTRTDAELRSLKGLDYLYPVDPPTFRSPAGEAEFNLIINYFKQTLNILELKNKKVNAEDRALLEEVKKKLLNLKSNPPSWEEISILETQRLIILDKLQRRQSIYKE